MCCCKGMSVGNVSAAGSSLLGGQLLAGRILRLQLTSEDDPFFLHTMEVSEEDFQTLKADQAILVDFGAFPQEVRLPDGYLFLSSLGSFPSTLVILPF